MSTLRRSARLQRKEPEHVNVPLYRKARRTRVNQTASTAIRSQPAEEKHDVQSLEELMFNHAHARRSQEPGEFKRILEKREHFNKGLKEYFIVYHAPIDRGDYWPLATALEKITYNLIVEKGYQIGNTLSIQPRFMVSESGDHFSSEKAPIPGITDQLRITNDTTAFIEALKNHIHDTIESSINAESYEDAVMIVNLVVTMFQGASNSGLAGCGGKGTTSDIVAPLESDWGKFDMKVHDPSASNEYNNCVLQCFQDSYGYSKATPGYKSNAEIRKALGFAEKSLLSYSQIEEVWSWFCKNYNHKAYCLIDSLNWVVIQQSQDFTVDKWAQSTVLLYNHDHVKLVVPKSVVVGKKATAKAQKQAEKASKPVKEKSPQELNYQARKMLSKGWLIDNFKKPQTKEVDYDSELIVYLHGSTYFDEATQENKVDKYHIICGAVERENVTESELVGVLSEVRTKSIVCNSIEVIESIGNAMRVHHYFSSLNQAGKNKQLNVCKTMIVWSDNAIIALEKTFSRDYVLSTAKDVKAVFKLMNSTLWEMERMNIIKSWELRCKDERPIGTVHPTIAHWSYDNFTRSQGYNAVVCPSRKGGRSFYQANIGGRIQFKVGHWGQDSVPSSHEELKQSGDFWKYMDLSSCYPASMINKRYPCADLNRICSANLDEIETLAKAGLHESGGEQFYSEGKMGFYDITFAAPSDLKHKVFPVKSQNGKWDWNAQSGDVICTSVDIDTMKKFNYTVIFKGSCWIWPSSTTSLFNFMSKGIEGKKKSAAEGNKALSKFFKAILNVLTGALSKREGEEESLRIRSTSEYEEFMRTHSFVTVTKEFGQDDVILKGKIDKEIDLEAPMSRPVHLYSFILAHSRALVAEVLSHCDEVYRIYTDSFIIKGKDYERLVAAGLVQPKATAEIGKLTDEIDHDGLIYDLEIKNGSNFTYKYINDKNELGVSGKGPKHRKEVQKIHVVL